MTNAHPQIPFSRTASIIVPTYNCRELLARTLSGLKLQTYPANLLEVIIADDGSSDDTQVYLRKFQASGELRSVRQCHVGFRLASIRNKAILAARNEIIINLDADMIPMPEFVVAHMKWFHVFDHVAVIGHRRFVDMNGIKPSDIEKCIDDFRDLPEVKSASNWFMNRDRRLREFRGFDRHPAPYNLFHGCNVAYPRQSALEVGLYDEEFNAHWVYEDIEFGYRLWRHGMRFINETQALALHQENTVLRHEDRATGDQHNFALACRKIPGFSEFRKRLARARREPWWA